MSLRNKNAWIKAARKVAAKTGGLSRPSLLKAYTAAKVKLGREPKGTDVKKHPIIFKRIIRQVEAGSRPKTKPVGKRVPERTRGGAVAKKARPARPQEKRVRRIVSRKSFEELLELQEFQGFFPEVEYASTAEY